MKTAARILLLLVLFTPAARAQIQTFTGVAGLGHSTMGGTVACKDRDGDGYGVGPTAVVNTTLASSVAKGVTSISVASATGISTGMVLTVDLVQNMEKAIVSGVSGTTITLSSGLLLAHTSGIVIKDEGCLGSDADDNDPLVWNAAQAITKYGSIAGLLTKIGNDIILDNPIPNGSASAIAAGYASPNHTWYLAPSSASPAGSDSNGCNVITAPCLTFSRLSTQGYAAGDLVLLRDQWNGACSPTPGTSSKYSVILAYPGEKPKITGGAGNNCSMVGTQVSPFDYVVIDGLAIGSGSSISGGTQDVLSGVSGIHDILLRNIEGAGGTNAGTGIGWINFFNGLSNFTVEYSNLYGNDCTGGSCQHGMYNGSRELASDHVTYRRNLAWQNDSNGLTFNGRCSSCVFDQNASWSNGVSGLTLEMGVINSFARSNLLVSNANSGITIFNYVGNCYDLGSGSATVSTSGTAVTWNSSFDSSNFSNDGSSNGLLITINRVPYVISTVNSGTSITLTTSAGTQTSVPFYPSAPICPYAQTGNLFENNTIWQTANVNVTNPNNSPGSCPGGTSYCSQAGIIVNNSTPDVYGSLGSNSYLNDIITSYGYSNHYPPMVIGDPTGTGTCDATCLGWLSSSTFSGDLFFQTDGNGGTGTIAFGAGAGFGFHGYTCAQAATYTMISGCLDGDPKFVNEAISLWNNEGAFDLRLLSSSPAFEAGTTTTIPVGDVAGRAFLDDKPDIGSLQHNPLMWGWNDLGSATQVSCPANGYPGGTNNISLTGTGGSPYPFATYCWESIYTWSDGAHYHGTGKHELVEFGGGHSDYIGNEVNSWQYWQSVPAWTRLSGPSTFIGDPGTGATFSATVSGGSMTSCSVTAPGSGYVGTGQVVWSGGGASSQAWAVYYVSGGQATACVPVYNQLGSGYTSAPTGTTANYSTPALAWTNSAPPAAMPELADGSANSTHATGSLSVSQADGKFIKWSGALAGGNGPHFADTFSYSLSTNSWTRLDPTVCSGCSTGTPNVVVAVGQPWEPQNFYHGSFDSLSVWNPLNDSHFYYDDEGGAGELNVYMESTDQWLYGGYGAPVIAGAASSNGMGRDIIPDRQLFYAIGSTGTGGTPVYAAVKVNLATVLTAGTSSASSITSSVSTSGPTSCATVWQTSNGSGQYLSPGMAWVQAIGKFVLMIFDGSGTYYTWDPDSLGCGTYTMSGGPGATSTPWAFGKLQYDPTIDALPVYQGFNTANTVSQDAFVLSLNAPDPQGGTPQVAKIGILGGTSKLGGTAVVQ